MTVNKEEFIKEFIVRNAGERYGLKEVEMHLGSSFVMGCGFYRTRYDGIYITDYDWAYDTDLEVRNQAMLFYLKRGTLDTLIISNEFFRERRLV